jgi:hypothetical protein
MTLGKQTNSCPEKTICFVKIVLVATGSGAPAQINAALEGPSDKARAGIPVTCTAVCEDDTLKYIEKRNATLLVGDIILKEISCQLCNQPITPTSQEFTFMPVRRSIYGQILLVKRTLSIVQNGCEPVVRYPARVVAAWDGPDGHPCYRYSPWDCRCLQKASRYINMASVWLSTFGNTRSTGRYTPACRVRTERGNASN